MSQTISFDSDENDEEFDSDWARSAADYEWLECECGARRDVQNDVVRECVKCGDPVYVLNTENLPSITG